MPAMPPTPAVGPRRALLVAAVGVVVIGVALHFFWPLGVVLGLVMGVVIVLSLGRQQERAARAAPQADVFSVFAPLGVAAAGFPAPHAMPAARAPLAIGPAAPAAVVPEALEPAEPVATAVVAERPAAAPVQAGRSARTPVPSVRPAAARAVPAPVRDERGVRADLDRLKDELGDDYPDFARAARLVVSTQYASAARLQRDLQLPYSRARRLLADLESQHFVGPATGTLPRQVLLPKERLPEVEQLFAGV